MKKIILGLFVIGTLSACENSDGPSTPGIVESHIFIDGQRFEPSPSTADEQFVTTTFMADVVDGEANMRTFNLVRTSEIPDATQAMTIIIVYPATRTSIDGTYEFNAPNFDPTNEAQASYQSGMMGYAFSEGTITVDDMGNDKYRLTFANSKVVELSNQNEEIPVTGYFEGVFSAQ